MEFGCLAVDCLDDLEIKELCDFLFKNGYFRFGRNEGYSLIAIDIDGTFYDLPSRDIVSKERKRITYQQFMEKYAVSDLKSKVEEAKKTLGLSNHELSLKLGHQKRYITNALLDPSVKRQKNIILKINALLLKESNDLTHDFEGKALHKHIDDAIMVGKDEYNNLNKENLDLKEHNANLFNENSVKDFKINQLKKELDHKTQVAEKHADMRNKAELRVSELEKIVESRDKVISQQLLNSGNQVYKINELKNQVESLQKDFLNSDTEVGNLKEKLNLSEQDSEKWQCDFWTVSRENIELINSKRSISIWLAVSILIIVVMLAFGVLHFNGVV